MLSSSLRGVRGPWLKRGVVPAISSSNVGRTRDFNAPAPPPDGKIYELRRYKIKPDKFTELVRHTTEKYKDIMMPYGKLLGYWTSHLGSQCECRHLWEYESYAHRDEVIEAKKSDERVQEEYLKFALSCMDSQHHVIMKTFPWYKPHFETPQKWGVYELVTQRVKPEMMPQLEHRLLQGLQARLDEDYPKPLAMWYSVFGEANLFVSLWPHESFDKRDEHREKLECNKEWVETRRDTAKFVDGIDVQGLVPLPWSPLQ